MKILMVDNFDSFTWNLVEYISLEEEDLVVEKNTVTVEEVREIDPDAIVLSPGPGHPAKKSDTGNMLEIIREFSDTPMLGVCLGHQAMAEAFGGEVDRAPEPVHGKTSSLEHDGEEIYDGLPQGFPVGRYHSLIVSETPEEFEVVSEADGLVMGIRHTERPMEGVEFHPESILTSHGHEMIENFVERAREHRNRREPGGED
ncbi:MAG: aminodeoxychorismate/anthranilate synthase component II [Candidatus Nanohaloarchaea archaeon]